MPEPATPLAATLAAAASSVTLALFGVEYHSLIWALFGALLAVYEAAGLGRIRSVVFVLLSTFAGAAVGSGLLAMWSSESRALLILFSLVAGFGAQATVNALLRAALARIDKLGGQ